MFYIKSMYKYLPNGQMCRLIEQISDNKFIIVKIYEAEEYDVEGDTIVVDAIFDSPPTEKISKEIKELKQKEANLMLEVSRLQKIKYNIDIELAIAKRTQIENDKFIINRSDLINAKSLALFEKNRVMPKLKDSNDKSFRGLKVSLTVDIGNGDVNSWGYKLYHDYNENADYLCPKYGILINPTDEEIESVIFKRLNEFKWDERELSKVDDKYLSESQIEIKQNYIKKQNELRVEQYKNEILKYDNLIHKILENPEVIH